MSYFCEMATESFLYGSVGGVYSQVLPQWSLACSDLWTCKNFQILFTSFIGKVCSAETLAFLCTVTTSMLCKGNSDGPGKWDGSLGQAGKKMKNVKRWNKIHLFAEPALRLNGTSVLRGLGLNALGDQQSAIG